MKKVYLQPITQDVPLHAGELMIPMEKSSGGGGPSKVSTPLNPSTTVPVGVAARYVI